ncbi:MAG TPA: fatty acid desaturase family protein [Candidatus Binatia bacterium]|nr:fatty acid desaturase family protein [Candidatus Binatia bacterium]
MTPPRWQHAISPAERRELLAVSDGRAWLSVALDWGLVGAAFAVVAALPHPLTVLLAIAVIGGRQLGFAILMHEAAHGMLFRSRALNDWVGNWLCAYPVYLDVHPYRRYHLKHHAKTWTADDPDLPLATPFPVTRASLARKIFRDLTGQTGWKRLRYTLKGDLGMSPGIGQRTDNPGWKSFRGMVVTNLVLLGALTIAGHPALYLLWVVAWFTTYSLVTRIRSIAEHAMIPDPTDELRQTRTTLARWWERLLIAPNHVNYHLEHHLLMTVPLYRLPHLHRMLRERGVLADACVTRGYFGILRLAASRPAA